MLCTLHLKQKFPGKKVGGYFLSHPLSAFWFNYKSCAVIRNMDNHCSTKMVIIFESWQKFPCHFSKSFYKQKFYKQKCSHFSRTESETVFRISFGIEFQQIMAIIEAEENVYVCCCCSLLDLLPYIRETDSTFTQLDIRGCSKAIYIGLAWLKDD